VTSGGKRTLHIYADTSVFGGCFDPEFEGPSRRFFELVARGRVILLVSQILEDELTCCPAQVRGLFARLRKDALSHVGITRELLALRDAYVETGVVGRRSREDAGHVAAATLARADAIVSWNFKHIVSIGRIQGYNHVNLRMGYRPLAILSPGDVLSHEEG